MDLNIAGIVISFAALTISLTAYAATGNTSNLWVALGNAALLAFNAGLLAAKLLP